MILKWDKQDADLIVDLEILIDGVLAEVASTDCVRTTLHQPVAAIYEFLDGRIVGLILVDLD